MSTIVTSTLDTIREKYEVLLVSDVIDSRDQHRIDRELSMLMSEMERIFDIPLLEKNLKEFRLQYPEVVTLYRQISGARKFDL